MYLNLIPHEKFRLTYLGKAAAAARAGQPSRTCVYGVLVFTYCNAGAMIACW